MSVAHAVQQLPGSRYRTCAAGFAADAPVSGEGAPGIVQGKAWQIAADFSRMGQGEG
ncbi:MAG: hypothetical protein P0Y58_18270 [Candidatus Pseudomonas phytovorans]|uniref:Uncharacterized protein n=1 Tax=Candidatus Pseudomonas phytovorans TaxID=3121377 RepID=A0AAJ6BA55_9PSED|nr:hypothetical protein [Pseudomonas sp.]WEK28852.1 MAG: hypothetical protein P0Y58_18270 [Pseudomonas sp.]